MGPFLRWNLSVHLVFEEAHAIEVAEFSPCHKISNIPLILYQHASWCTPYLRHVETTRLFLFSAQTALLFLSSKIKDCITFHCSVKLKLSAPSITIWACGMNKVVTKNPSNPKYCLTKLFFFSIGLCNHRDSLFIPLPPKKK